MWTYSQNNPQFREDLFDSVFTLTLSGIEQLSTELLLHLHEGNNPIYSSESVSTVVMNVYDWKQGRSELSMEMELKFPLLVSLIDSVKKEGFHVKPILTYRRFYEWVPSYYQQRICHLPTFSQLLDNPNPDCRISLRSWVETSTKLH